MTYPPASPGNEPTGDNAYETSPYAPPTHPADAVVTPGTETYEASGQQVAGQTTYGQNTYGQPGTGDVAKDEAAQVKDTAVESAQNVAHTAQDEARTVAHDAKNELRSLLDSGLNEARSQASGQQQRLAGGVRDIATEARQLLNGDVNSNGPLTQLTGELATRGSNAADWLESHEPEDLLDEVRRFAARRPWAFLGLAAAAGVLVGRFASGLRADANREDEYQQRRSIQGGAGQYPTYPQTQQPAAYPAQRAYTDPAAAQAYPEQQAYTQGTPEQDFTRSEDQRVIDEQDYQGQPGHGQTGDEGYAQAGDSPNRDGQGSDNNR